MLAIAFGSCIHIKDGVILKRPTLKYYSVGVRGVVKCSIFEKIEDALAFAETVEVPTEPEKLIGAPEYSDGYVVNVRDLCNTELTIIGTFDTFDAAERWIAENATEDNDVCSIKKLRTVGPLRNGVQS